MIGKLFRFALWLLLAGAFFIGIAICDFPRSLEILRVRDQASASGAAAGSSVISESSWWSGHFRSMRDKPDPAGAEEIQ